MNNLWEENDSTDQRQNCSNNSESVPNDITNDINPNSTPKQCENIGTEKKWTKNCPTCNRPQFFNHQSSLAFAKKRNSKCHDCRYKDTAFLIKTKKSDLIQNIVIFI